MTDTADTGLPVTQALRAYVKLFRAAKAISARLEPAVADAGLTLTQLGVLEAILHKGPLTQRELGRKVLTSAGNMTDVIDKLAARGLVMRTRQPSDRRAVRVELTLAGHEIISKFFPVHAHNIARAMSGLNEAELEELDRLLHRLGLAAAHEED